MTLAHRALAVALASLAACASAGGELVPRAVVVEAWAAPAPPERVSVAPVAPVMRAAPTVPSRPDPDCVALGPKNRPIMAEPEPGVVALTIDDGPMVGRTDAILDVLARHHVRATFFVVGRAITRKTFATIQRIVAEGHALGNHSWRHDLGPGFAAHPRLAAAFYAAEIGLTAARIDLALLARDGDDYAALEARVFDGFPRFMRAYVEIRALPLVRARLSEVLAERGRTAPLADITYMRPPYGRPFMAGPARDVPLMLAAIRAAGLVPVLWHRTSGDSDNRVPSAERLRPERLGWWFSEAVRGGGILLAHDRIPAASLDAVLTAAEAQGVRWVGLDGLAQPPRTATGTCGVSSGASASPRPR